jgi:hypothetical protein
MIARARLHICGGRAGIHATPQRNFDVAERIGLDGKRWCERAGSPSVDNNAIADGFQIYLHSFVLTAEANGRSSSRA